MNFHTEEYKDFKIQKRIDVKTGNAVIWLDDDILKCIASDQTGKPDNSIEKAKQYIDELHSRRFFCTWDEKYFEHSNEQNKNVQFDFFTDNSNGYTSNDIYRIISLEGNQAIEIEKGHTVKRVNVKNETGMKSFFKRMVKFNFNPYMHSAEWINQYDPEDKNSKGPVLWHAVESSDKKRIFVYYNFDNANSEIEKMKHFKDYEHSGLFNESVFNIWKEQF